MEEKLNTLIEQFGEFSNTLVEVKSTMDDFTHRLEALELKLGELSTKTTKSKKAAASIEEQLIKQTGPIKLHAKTITTKAKEEYKDNVEGFLNKYNIARADYDEAVKNHPDKVNDQFTELHSKYKVQINEIYTRVFNENQTTEPGDSKSTTTTIVKSTKKTPKKQFLEVKNLLNKLQQILMKLQIMTLVIKIKTKTKNKTKNKAKTSVMNQLNKN